MSGELDVSSRLHGAEGVEPRDLVGRATWTRADFGAWLREDFALDASDDGNRRGTVYLGPLAEEGRFELVQLDGEHPSALLARGAWDATERALVLETVACADAPEDAATRLRWTYRALESGGFEKRVERIDGGGRRVAAIHRYTRRP
jgi:hypothetical protein